MTRARRPVLGALLLLAASCGTFEEPPPPPPGEDTLPLPTVGLDLRTPALRARGAVEGLLGAAVPPEALAPLAVPLREMAEALSEELRPQVDMLHPGASQGARDTLLRSTANRGARSSLARWSTGRRRILFPTENLLPSMQALGLPTDRSTVGDFLAVLFAHEMVHAVDDGEHDLAATFRSAPDAEALRARGMVVEGRAVHYARRAAAALGIDPRLAAVLPGEAGKLDDYRARYLLTYREGAAFVADLEARGGRELAARALAHPPRLTSTVFHPGRYGAGGEEEGPDLAAAMAAAGFEGAAAASELDLRARWLPVLGEERTARAFAGFRAGAGLHRGRGGASVSLHDTPADAAAYADGLRGIYGMAGGAEAGTVEGMAAVVLVRGRTVASAVAGDPEEARREAGRALGAGREGE